jgi:uncharacterized protein YeaO (DUF488 family)
MEVVLRQASVADVRKGRVSRARGRVVVAMRIHPRGFAKSLRDEYVAALAPAPDLFADFRRAKAWHEDHERAFADSRYEDRFFLGAEGVGALARLSGDAWHGEVFLVCQCEVGERCHRELLLLAARTVFGAPVDVVHHEYPAFARRLAASPPGSPSRIP